MDRRYTWSEKLPEGVVSDPLERARMEVAQAARARGLSFDASFIVARPLAGTPFTVVGLLQHELLRIPLDALVTGTAFLKAEQFDQKILWVDETGPLGEHGAYGVDLKLSRFMAPGTFGADATRVLCMMTDLVRVVRA